MKKIFILVFVPFFILLLTSCESYSNYEQIYFNQENDFLNITAIFINFIPGLFMKVVKENPLIHMVKFM